MKKFNIWSLFSLLFTGIAYFLFESGVFHVIWDADISKISFVIMIFAVYSYCRLGWLIRLYELGEEIEETEIAEGFEIADWMMSFGMIGTVVGFIAMTSSFTTVDFGNTENIKELFILATQGMSTALYSTLVGLIAYIILRIGFFFFDSIIESEKNATKK